MEPLIQDRILKLWEKNRLRCGWYVRKDFVPLGKDDCIFCLGMVIKHGDREAYKEARGLLKEIDPWRAPWRIS